MKIYRLFNKKVQLSDCTFSGLVSMDIGYKTYGVTIINPKGEFKTIDLKPISSDTSISKLSIPEYLKLSLMARNTFVNLLEKKPQLQKYVWSMEIPNIVGSFAPALSILLTTISLKLLEYDIPYLLFAGNRLGGFYLKKRSYTKTEIKNLVKAEFNIDYKISDHEADSLLQAYSIYLGLYNKHLKDVSLRPFETIIEDLN